MNRPLALTLSALLLAGCGSGSAGSSAGGDQGSASVVTTGEAGAQQVVVGMNDKLQFAPSTVKAKVGTVTLDVKNLGRVPHNLHFDETSLGRTATIAGDADEKLTVTFAQAGTFTFVCTFHDGMVGKVVVS